MNTDERLTGGARALAKCVAAVAAAVAITAGADELTVAADGTFRLNGKPAFLVGNLIYGAPTAEDYKPFFANVPGWEWLYERPPTREQFDRLGFNATGGEVSTSWLRKYRPESVFWQGGFQIDWKGVAPGYYRNGLPALVDFTCAEWSHGSLDYEEGRLPSRAAFSSGDCHNMPYSVLTDEGFALYREMWQGGARELKAHGVKPFLYELFNEPSYHDTSPAAEAAFAKYCERNLPLDAPAAAKKILRMRFDEQLFARAMKRGKEALREIDPDARTCYQPLGVSFGRLDLLLANETTDVVMTPTGGGDQFEALCCLAVAGDRPVIDGETYLGSTRESHRAAILREYARGLNASWYYHWGRRSRRHKMWNEPDGPRRVAEILPYECLNPAACPPEAFAGMKDAEAEIAAVNDLFGSRLRGIVPEIALLVSSASERYSLATKTTSASYVREVAHALLSAHLPVKVIYEEQLDEKHLAGVKMIVAAGVDAVLPETNKRLRRWIEKGGRLLTIEGRLELTEWGYPDSSAFVLGSAGSIGAGRYFHVMKRPSPIDAPADFRHAAYSAGVSPSCVITAARTGAERLNIECAAARVPAPDGKGEEAAGFIVVDNDLAPYAVKLKPVAVGAGFRNWIDVRTQKRLPTTEKGEILLKLLPGVPVVIRSAADDCAMPLAETSEEFFASLVDWYSAKRPEVFRDHVHVDPETTASVDLRGAANGSLEKLVGKTPWGVQECEGVPFDFIRADQNDGNSGVFLDEKPVTVDVRGCVRAYDLLFYAPAKGRDGPFLDVEVTCEAGCRQKYTLKAPEDLRLKGWSNLDGNYLFLARFFSRTPWHPVKSMRFVSRRKGVVLAACTVERLDVDPFVAAFRPEVLRFSPWGGVKVEVSGDDVYLKVDESTADWAGVAANFVTPILLTERDVSSRSLVFEIRQGLTPSGVATRPAPPPQVALVFDREADGRMGAGPYAVNRRDSLVDANSETWQEFRIPLRRLIDRDSAQVSGFNVQLRPFGSQRSSFIIRALRIE